MTSILVLDVRGINQHNTIVSIFAVGLSKLSQLILISIRDDKLLKASLASLPISAQELL